MLHLPVDLRSDTVTKPTEGMRRAIATATVGDDVFDEDTTTRCLEERVASLLGKDAALFVPSGTMGNQLALAIQSAAGDEVIVDRECHIVHYETAAPSLIARVQLRTVDLVHQTERILAVLDDTARSSEYYYPRTRGVCIENSHNRCGGAILPLETVRTIAQWCHNRGYFLHCDGARLWNVSVATGISLAEYASPCTTVMVCLSKGLGAPVGSVLAGPRDLIAEARRWRKMLGGGMRQTGILAAAGLFALDHHLDRLAEDHTRARYFAQAIAEEFELLLVPPPTNIVLFRSRRAISTDLLLAAMRQEGVLFSQGPSGWLRAVFHLDIDDAHLKYAIRTLLNVHAQMVGRLNFSYHAL